MLGLGLGLGSGLGLGLGSGLGFITLPRAVACPEKTGGTK